MASAPDAGEAADARPAGSGGPDAGPLPARGVADQLREESEALKKQCKVLESLAVSMRRLQEMASSRQAQLMAENTHLKRLYEAARATRERTGSSLSRSSSSSTACAEEGTERPREPTNDTAEDLERVQQEQFKREQSGGGLQREEERMENPTHSNNSTTVDVKEESRCSESTHDAAEDLESVQHELLEFKSEQSESCVQRKEERMESPAPRNNNSIQAEEEVEHRRESTNAGAEDPERARHKQLEFNWEPSVSGSRHKGDFDAKINRGSKVLL